MLLEDATIEMRWHNTNKKKYMERGYKFTTQELCEAIDILTTTNKWFKKIELGKC